MGKTNIEIISETLKMEPEYIVFSVGFGSPGDELPSFKQVLELMDLARQDERMKLINKKIKNGNKSKI